VVSRRAGELDRVARGVLEQDLAAAPPRDDVVTEAGPALAQRLDLALEVGDLDLDAIPAPGLGRTAMGHRLSCAARAGPIEQQPQVASREHRKAGSGPHLDVEAELLDVEVNRGVDVIGDVANADRGHSAHLLDMLILKLFIS
jgi:hypothetical protein